MLSIFGSKKSSGNTCAHAMNVASMASVLPRTPSDMNDTLSVVFIGNQKFDPLCIYTLFCIHMKGQNQQVPCFSETAQPIIGEY